MEPLPQPPAPRFGDPRPISATELALIEALLPKDFPNRQAILDRGESTRVRELTESLRYLWWPIPTPYGREAVFTRDYVNAMARR